MAYLTGDISQSQFRSVNVFHKNTIHIIIMYKYMQSLYPGVTEGVQ